MPRELRASEAERAEVGERHRVVLAEERRIDDEAQAVGERADEVNKRLYSGTVSSPRELQAMQADIDMLHRRRSDLEDEELEIMEQREALDGGARRARRRDRGAAGDGGAVAADDRARPRPRSTTRSREESAARAELGQADRGVAAARLRAPPVAEPRRGRGPARRHDVPGVPPHDPVDGGRADPPRGRERGRVLRQLLRDPRAVTQASLFERAVGRTQARRGRRSYCDGGSRGQPGSVGDRRGGARPRRRSAPAPRRGERAHRRDDEQRRRVPRAHRRARGRRARSARTCAARARRLEARHRAGEGRVEGEAAAPAAAARGGARGCWRATPRSICSTCRAPRTPTPTRW